MKRRDFVLGGGAVAALAALVACTPTPPALPTAAAPAAPAAAAAPPTQAPPPPTQAAQPAQAAKPAAAAPTAAPAAAAGSGLTLPNSGAKLPSDPLTLRWADNAGLKAIFFKDFLPAYQKAHPNITVTYDGLPLPELAKVVPLGIQNGNAPDVFELPTGFTGAQAVQQGWARALDDIIPNFAEWKKSYPPGIFVNGNNVFDGS